MKDIVMTETHLLIPITLLTRRRTVASTVYRRDLTSLADKMASAWGTSLETRV